MSLNNILKREIGRLLQHKAMCAGCGFNHKKWDSTHWNLDKVGTYFFEVDVIYGFLESVYAESFCDNLKFFMHPVINFLLTLLLLDKYSKIIFLFLQFSNSI